MKKNIYRNWLITFIASFLIGCIFVFSINYLIDPYGAFGDKVLNMNSYGLEYNSRLAKIPYLDKNYEKFDTYILGGSKVGALLPEDIDKAYGAKSYNMMMTMGEFDAYEKTIDYIIDNYDPKRIILQLSVLEIKYFGEREALSSRLNYKVSDLSPFGYFYEYGKLNLEESVNKLYTFAEKTDDYDKDANISILTGVQNRDSVIKKIAKRKEKFYRKEDYETLKATEHTDVKAKSDGSKIKFTSFTSSTKGKRNFVKIDKSLEALQKIVDKCNENNVEFVLLSAPTCNKEFEIYPADKLKDYMTKIAEICPYWNFTGYNEISYNYWNFYDVNHYRIPFGRMMLTKMTGTEYDDMKVKDVPKDYGVFITPENAEEELEKAFTFTNPEYIENKDDLIYNMTFGPNPKKWQNK